MACAGYTFDRDKDGGCFWCGEPAEAHPPSPSCPFRPRPRLARLRPLRAYGLFMAGYTYEEIRHVLGRYDRDGGDWTAGPPVTSGRARQLGERGRRMVRWRLPWRFRDGEPARRPHPTQPPRWR